MHEGTGRKRSAQTQMKVFCLWRIRAGGNEMKKLYEKNELTFAIVWIVIYCALQSFANPLNELIGIEYAASAVFCILQAAVLFLFIRKNNLQKRYGLCKPPVPARRFLYYAPLILLAT